MDTHTKTSKQIRDLRDALRQAGGASMEAAIPVPRSDNYQLHGNLPGGPQIVATFRWTGQLAEIWTERNGVWKANNARPPRQTLDAFIKEFLS